MQELNLYDLLRYYVKNWLILLIVIFIGAIIGLVYTSYIQTPLFKSEATMIVVGERTAQDATINNNYTELFKSRRVLETVIDAIDYSGDYRQLLGRTTATNDKNTDVIRVSIADNDARKSKQLLAASLDTFKKEAGALYDSSNIKTVDAANLPATAYNVNVPVQIGLATAASFFMATIVLFFLYDYRMSMVPTVTNARAKRTTIPAPSENGKRAKAKKTLGKTSTSKVVKRSVLNSLVNLLVEAPPEKKSKSEKTK